MSAGEGTRFGTGPCSVPGSGGVVRSAQASTASATVIVVMKVRPIGPSPVEAFQGCTPSPGTANSE